MTNRAQLLGRFLHPLVIGFPVVLLATAVVLDLIDLATGTGAFTVAAYWIMAAGIVSALAAAPLGFVDWLHIAPGTRAKRVGALRRIGNLVALAVFAGSWLLREPEAGGSSASLTLALVAVALALATAFLRVEPVSRLDRSVYDTRLDAPSSLSFEPSTQAFDEEHLRSRKMRAFWPHSR